MKTRTIVLMMALCFIATAVCLASDVNVGTWKLNEAKSKFPPGATKNQTVTYEAMGDQVKVTLDGTAADGKSVHIEWTGKYDGKFYPVTGDSNVDERSYKQINRSSVEVISKKDGKIVGTTRVVVAPDGKSRIVTSTNSKGEKSFADYDKE